MSLKLLLAIALFQVSLVLSAQEKFNLAYHYQPGEIYRYRTHDSISSQQEINGQDMKLSGGTQSLIKLEVVSVLPDSSMTFNTSYEEMKTIVKSPMMDTVMEQRELIGKRAQVVVNKNGKEISKVMLDSIVHQGNKIAMSTASNFSVNFFQLPGHPVAADEKWTAEIHDSTAFEAGYTVQNGSVEYTLNGTEQKNGHRCLKIGFSAKGEHAGKMKQMGMNVFIEGTSDTKGFLWFDAGAGILVCRESAALQEMTYAITGPMTMSVPMTQNIKSSYRLVEK